jgi:hypothetical protein
MLSLSKHGVGDFNGLRTRVQSRPYVRAPVRELPYLPALCLALATLHLNLGLLLALFATQDIGTFFYQPRVLAVTHTLTLGWISLAIIGVLYRFVPALTKQQVRRPWLARVQVGLFLSGAWGLVSHFWIGHLNGMAWSAGVLLLAVVLLLRVLLPLLLRAPTRDATVLGIIVALFCFLGVATLGFLYAVDKVHPFLGGNVLSNIAGHAHLAVLGWVTLTICAVSYRMVAAFTLPERVLPVPARRQVVSLAICAPSLAVALLLRSWTVAPLAFLTAASLVWYATIIARLLRTRRQPIDWSIRHVLAALAHLCAAGACGMGFALGVDVGGAFGTHLAVAYGVLALLGWVSNFILGMGSRLAPGLAAATGLAPQPLLSPRIQAVIFWTFNAGVVGVAAAVLGDAPQLLRMAVGGTLVATASFAHALIERARVMIRAGARTTHDRP